MNWIGDPDLVNPVSVHVIESPNIDFYSCVMFLLLWFQVVVPSLHLGLGIYKNLFDKLEAECHEIDNIIYKALVVDGSDDKDSPEPASNFAQRIGNQIQKNKLIDQEIQKQKDHLEQLLDEIPLFLLKGSMTDEEVTLSRKVVDLIVQKNKTQDKIESLVGQFKEPFSI